MKLLLPIFLFQFTLFSQKNDFFILNSTTISNQTSDLKQLDSLFSNRKLIGIGESTHGTSEFTTMRFRLFKYLVENHQFNTFFLEADFGACLRVNQYINGNIDSADSALFEVKSWPWITSEMLEIIEWSKKYNALNHNFIHFIGCDMQLIKDDNIVLSRIFKNNDKALNDLQNIFEGTTNYLPDSILISRKQKWSEFWVKHSNNIQNSLSENTDLLNITIHQWFNEKIKKEPRYNFRDSCMATNILDYLNLNSKNKGFYFAHNGHISNLKIDYKKSYSYQNAGHFLKTNLKDEYFIIGQLTNEGTFNSIVDMKKFEIINIPLTPSKKNTIEFGLNNLGSEIILIETKHIPSKNLMKTSIGGIYTHKTRYNKYFSNEFDAILFIKTTTASHLLKK